MRLPRGQLIRSRVVENAATALATALDRELTGYAILEPQDALLLDGDDAGVLTFEAGIPVLAYHVGTDRGGPRALADLAHPGPFKVELYRLSAADLEPAHEIEQLRVPPEMPAEQLYGDPELADRTRRATPPDRLDEHSGAADPVAAFLEDEEKIAAIREQARQEARQRATEWGLAGALKTDGSGLDDAGEQGRGLDDASERAGASEQEQGSGGHRSSSDEEMPM